MSSDKDIVRSYYRFAGLKKTVKKQDEKSSKIARPGAIGSEVDQAHILARTDEPPWIRFPKGFCLKPLEGLNGSRVCEEPMGISVVVYEANPLTSYPSSFLLAPDTQVLDADVTDR